MANNKKLKQFPITSICREDLEEADGGLFRNHFLD